MSKRRRRIADLIADKSTDRRPLRVKLGAAKWKRYKEDLAAVVQAGLDGQGVPNSEELSVYFRDSLKAEVAASTIRQHIRDMKRGKAI